jgi:hypothetical protein
VLPVLYTFPFGQRPARAGWANNKDNNIPSNNDRFIKPPKKLKVAEGHLAMPHLGSHEDSGCSSCDPCGKKILWHLDGGGPLVAPISGSTA